MKVKSNIKDWSERNIVNRYKQYGFLHMIQQIVKASVSFTYKCNHHLVYIIPEFQSSPLVDPCIIALDLDRVNNALISNEFDDQKASLFMEFLRTDCRGICAEIDGKLAGYAWIQYSGEYPFGMAARLKIPPEYAVAKNLYVFPEYRGRSIGKKLNEARLANIEPGATPVGLIIPENRYAIRNWKKYGFKCILEVKQSKFFYGKWKLRIKTLSQGIAAVTLANSIGIVEGK